MKSLNLIFFVTIFFNHYYYLLKTTNYFRILSPKWSDGTFFEFGIDNYDRAFYNVTC